MSTEEYKCLKERSKATGLSANAWLMDQLGRNRPVLHREAETREIIRFMDEAGWEINTIAREFNSGNGTPEGLQRTARLLEKICKHIHALREKGYPHAP